MLYATYFGAVWTRLWTSPCEVWTSDWSFIHPNFNSFNRWLDPFYQLAGEPGRYGLMGQSEGRGEICACQECWCQHGSGYFLRWWGCGVLLELFKFWGLFDWIHQLELKEIIWLLCDVAADDLIFHFWICIWRNLHRGNKESWNLWADNMVGILMLKTSVNGNGSEKGISLSKII